MDSRPSFLAVLLLCCLGLLAACAEEPPPADDDDTEPPPEFVDGTFIVSAAESSTLLEGLVLHSDEEEFPTDADGRVRVTLPSNGDFDMDLVGEDYADHRISGRSAESDFQFPVEIRSQGEWGEAHAALGIEQDPSRGTLVVGLLTLALQPAQEASVSIDGDSDPPFIFVDDDPQAGSELIFGASAQVVFPNVPPGEAIVTPTAPEGTVCLNFPALTATEDRRGFDLFEGGVTLALFLCH
ncbi:MAG: hypothetical protein VX498_14060 [Myxococcota bacterium]|nr:hypothetical protein [Myxococcota bacterium]